MNVLPSISGPLVRSVFHTTSILSGKRCGDLELTQAEQQALPWLHAASTNSRLKLENLPAGRENHHPKKILLNPNWDAQKIAFEYEMPVSHWIQEFKYASKIERGRLLADLFAQRFELSPESESELASSHQVQALIPVPIHLQRYRQRGFNQSRRLAKRLSHWSGIPIVDDAVKRLRNTPPQAELDAKQRQKNLQDAFEVEANALQSLERVALVDDVVTTGATMNELIRQIRQQTEIKWIEVWAIAQTQVE